MRIGALSLALASQFTGLRSRAVTDARASSGPGDGLLPWRRRAPRHVEGFLSPAVRNALAQVTDAPAPDEVIPFNNVRRRAAKALIASKRTAPHALAVVAADYTPIERVRSEAGLTALPFVARAVVDALHAFPLLNASVDGEALVVHRAVRLGIAVDLDYQGLVVPVVHESDGMRLRPLAAAIRDVGSRARAKQLTPDDLAGGTFTITNPGAAGTWMSFPVLNAPQVGIVSTDGVAKRVVVDEGGRMRIAPVGHLCLTFDHRALDGAYAGAFLTRLREIIEQRDWAAEL
jgi:2-oxoglutarate dehydrogenase E2 component (dihydrolipoamide succinyltransferase)